MDSPTNSQVPQYAPNYLNKSPSKFSFINVHDKLLTWNVI